VAFCFFLLFILAYNCGTKLTQSRNRTRTYHETDHELSQLRELPKNKMRTDNRPTPEGAWDQDIPCNVEDSPHTSSYAVPAKPTPLLALGLLHYTKENYQMMQGWRTLLVAMGIAVVGAAQANGAAWTEVLGPSNAGYVTMVLGFVMGFLRSITTTPSGVK
jgi:hypothetical protein